jgi:hypothetical protein
MTLSYTQNEAVGSLNRMVSQVTGTQSCRYNVVMGPENVSSRLAKAALRPSDDSEPALIPSKETLEEVRTFLKRYAEEMNCNEELSQSSKSMYIDFATCFVRWMYGGFAPGSRSSRSRQPTVSIWPGRKD